VSEDVLLRPEAGVLERGVVYYGGSARALEKTLGLSGDEILYVGDHMFGDVHVTKNVLRWRTALILRELEEEIEAIERFGVSERKLAEKMEQKEALERELCEVRLALQRKRHGYGGAIATSERDLGARQNALREQIEAIDIEIGPMAQEASALLNPTWGLLTRAGNDKSHLARQLERYADVYTSRVSNFLYATPFVYLRSPRGSLPHDPLVSGGTPLAPSGVPSP
jgi:5'-nucleotidase